jgi:hypothetical protein
MSYASIYFKIMNGIIPIKKGVAILNATPFEQNSLTLLLNRKLIIPL